MLKKSAYIICSLARPAMAPLVESPPASSRGIGCSNLPLLLPVIAPSVSDEASGSHHTQHDRAQHAMAQHGTAQTCTPSEGPPVSFWGDWLQQFSFVFSSFYDICMHEQQGNEHTVQGISCEEPLLGSKVIGCSSFSSSYCSCHNT